jgi:succinyl-CoA synthetase alpha subunit
MQPERVTVTVDGKKVEIPRGVLNFRDLVKAFQADPKTSKITVVSTPTPATTIGGNDSFTINGGEVFTTTHP